MRAIVKNTEEIALMRNSGALLAQVFEHLDNYIQEGVSTMQINDEAERFIVEELNARPASIGQYDYPFAINASLNDVICHGLPNSSRFLTRSDIVNIDITLEKNGFIADSSKTYVLDDASKEAHRLVDTCYAAMCEGIRQVKPGASLGDVAHAIQSLAEKSGYTVVREYGGHGIGRQMHEAPQVLHYGRPSTGMVLQAGMTFTIEPMINLGGRKTKTMNDGWTVVTQDQSLSAQWEHTVLVSETAYEVLTLRKGETI